MSTELDQFIQDYRGFIIIHLRHSQIESESELDLFLKELEAKNINQIRIVQLTAAEHKQWIQKYRIYGVPAIIVFRNGLLCMRLRGRLSVKNLKQLLQEDVFRNFN